MSVFSKLGKILGGTVVDVAEKGSDIVERWVSSAESKHEMATDIDKAIEASVQARVALDATPPGNNRTWFDSLVDGVNRMIRPGVTIGLFGGVFAWWPLPKIGDVDPIILSWIGTVFLFWFGGRAIFKDLPSVIKYLRAARGDKE